MSKDTTKTIPVYSILNDEEKQKLLAADEAHIKRCMELTIELNKLAERAGVIMKEYIEEYQKITAAARLRPIGGAK